MSGRVLLLAALALLAGCRGPAATRVEAPLGGAPRFAPMLPDERDAAAADLAVAVLAGHEPAVAQQLRALERSERQDAQPSGLLPFAHDAAHAALHPGRSWRHATARLLDERDDVEPALRARLERSLADDPLVLARERLGEARFAGVARVFNAVSAPVGRSILNPVQLPYTLGYSLARAAVTSAEGDALDLRRRQVLVHWRDFVRRHPDAPEVAELAPRIEDFGRRWERTRAADELTRARGALGDGRVPAALLYAERSLRHREGDEARALRDEARARLAAERDARARALDFAKPAIAAPLAPGERGAILAALASDARGVAGPELGGPPDALRFLRAGALAERDEAAMESELEALADAGDDSPMARHAAAELADPLRHPARAFRLERSAERRRTALQVGLGPLRARPGHGALAWTGYLLDLPLRLQALALFPIRALELTWRKPTPGQARAAAHARHHLALHPEGERTGALRDWLVRYEKRRKNWIGVLRLAESAPDPDPDELARLRERAAEQGLAVARAEQRRDLRAALLASVGRRYPGTHAAREAGRDARRLALESTPHEIRFSRGFLLENPEIAGPEGLDLSPALLDDEPRNGELHPEGVALVGGREAVVNLLAASGDDDDPPEKLYATLPAERLSRLVARVEESRFRRALLDPEDALEADPQRDAVFERARLGLADSVDERPSAEARHAYRGMRERYGMVRSRGSILPVELVVQGSLAEASLGAFPRLIPAAPTPDAILYRD